MLTRKEPTPADLVYEEEVEVLKKQQKINNVLKERDQEAKNVVKRL